MSIPVLNYNFFSGQRTENYAVFSSQSVNLLQIVMVSPGTHLVKNNESLFRTNESHSGLEITAGQRTMSGQNRALSEQIRG